MMRLFVEQPRLHRLHSFSRSRSSVLPKQSKIKGGKLICQFSGLPLVPPPGPVALAFQKSRICFFVVKKKIVLVAVFGF